MDDSDGHIPLDGFEAQEFEGERSYTSTRLLEDGEITGNVPRWLPGDGKHAALGILCKSAGASILDVGVGLSASLQYRRACLH